MKPWPEEIRKRFPLHRDQDPQRPWWRSGFGVLPTRTDGLPLPRSTQGHNRWRLPGEPWNTLDKGEAMGAWDKENPIPHPGFRVGQVWATQKGEAWQVALGSLGHLAILVFDTNAFGKPSGLDFVLLGPGWDFGSADDLFLVADPCCPWLAPWAPK